MILQTEQVAFSFAQGVSFMHEQGGVPALWKDAQARRA